MKVSTRQPCVKERDMMRWFAAVILTALVAPVDDAASPPPPKVESAFMKNIVLRKDDFTRLTSSLVFPSDPKFNTVGKSAGLAFKFRYEQPPQSTSPISLWDDAGPILQLRAISDTRLDLLV